MNGIELIAKEREEQIKKHGRTVEQDVKYNNYNQLSIFASTLCSVETENIDLENVDFVPQDWANYQAEYMLKKTYKERLIIAGALICAEIDRLKAVEEKIKEKASTP